MHSNAYPMINRIVRPPIDWGRIISRPLYQADRLSELFKLDHSFEKIGVDLIKSPQLF
jgi:hypothetical protein